ncbi:MAG: hypothetical protein LDL33_13310 [Desulfomonile sp.]|nr:hypothetical protein [Desulfomonile sp.]
MKKFLILMALALFVFTSTAALAADQYFVLKDKNNKCYVKKLKAQTPATIAGPFASKAEADKVKAEKCPKPAKAPDKK